MFPPRAARRQQRRFPGTEPGTKKCWVDVQPIRVCRVVVVWRIQFPPSDALRLNRDGPPLSRLFFCSAERRLTAQKRPTGLGMPQAARR